MSKIVVSTKLLAAVAKWSTDDDMKPHLRCVLFRNAEMVACDGHRLVRVPIACNGIAVSVDRDLVASAEAAQAFCSKTAARDNEYGGPAMSIRIDGNQVAIDLGGFTMRGPLRDPSTYPAIDQVMPNGRPDRHPDGYGFDPKYLAAISEVQIAAGATVGAQGVRITGWSADGLGAMLFEGHMGIRYVVMPVRT